MSEEHYVALRPLRFGRQELLPGDPVPVEPGRDYRLMRRLGQIGPAHAGAAATPPDLSTPAPARGQRVVFVGVDSTHSLAVFLTRAQASEDDAEALDVPVGAAVAAVQFEDDPNPVVVRLDSLLPDQPTLRLIENLGAQASEVQLALVDKLEERITFLELLIRAVRESGEVIPGDFPAVEQLAQNGVETLPGLRILVDGEQGRANLMALDAIGASRADKILAAVAALAPAEPPTPDG